MQEQQFIQKIKDKKSIIIYGAGMVGKLVYSRLCSQGLKNKIIGFAVSERVESSYLGVFVYAIGDLYSYNKEACVVIATLPVLHQEILEKLYTYDFTDVWKVTEDLFNSMSLLYIEQFKREHTLNKQKIDILFMASDNSSSSGAFLCMLDLNIELKKRGISTAVVLPEYGNGEELLRQKNVDFTYIISRHWGKKKHEESSDVGEIIELQNENAIGEIEKFITDHQVRLVHNNTTYTYVGAVAARNRGIPWVWHIRENIYEQGYEFLDYKNAMEWINQSSKILVVSRFIKSCYKDFDDSKISIIYDGVDTKDYYFVKEGLLKNKKTVLAVVGVITDLKGQKDMIEAARILKRQPIDFQVLLVGGGDKDYTEYLHTLVREYQLEQEIVFCGKRDDIYHYYQKADIVVVCSRAEAFGRVTIEARLSGCLVIGADAGATSELLADKETGLLYKKGNGKDLAEKIIEAVSEKENSRKMAQCGQRYVYQTYSKERNAEQIMKVYEEILSRLKGKCFGP